MKKIIPFMFLSVVLLTSFTLASCNSGSTSALKTINSAITNTISATDTAILLYANPETETTLQGLSQDNLTKYIQYGDSAFKASLTQAALDATTNTIASEYGTYVSKEFQSSDQQQGYTLVYYTAIFTKGNFTVQMVFDAKHQVEDVSYMLSSP